MDKEEIIRRLKKISEHAVHVTGEPPFIMSLDDGIALDEAARLLKEQEAEWIGYPECLAYDGAYSDSHIVCSACKYVFNIMDDCTEEFHYCPHCGAKMET